MTPSRIIKATAPIRICDNGGWTDTWVARHGKVFNLAVRPLVSVRIDVFPSGTRDAHIILDARNYNDRYALDPATWGLHPLLEAAFREIRPPDDVDLEVTIWSKAPAGASTGTSAAVVVALLGALDRLTGGRRTPLEIALAAHAVETIHLGRQSGVQDQICSVFGGASYIEIADYPQAVVTQLPLSDTLRSDLQRRLALIYLGRPHRSSETHERVMRDLEREGPDCARLTTLRAAAERARDAVVAGDLDAFGQAMCDNTTAQAQLQRDLIPPDAWRAIAIAEAHNAAGWKVNGAGGDGGSLTLLASNRPGAKRAMVHAIMRDNPRLQRIPIVLSAGLRVWDTDSE